MFALPGTPKAPSPAKGLLESENPLHRLTDIDIDEFKQFLRVLYPRHFEDEKLQPKEWIAVLKLATTWRFEKVRRIAIKAIEGEKMTGTKGGLSLLMLSQTYDVKEWLLPALRILSTDKPLKEDFVEKISLTTSLKVATLQGLVTGFRMKAAKGAKDMEIAPDELDRIIKTVFPEVDVKESETPNGSTNGTKGPDGGKSSK